MLFFNKKDPVQDRLLRMKSRTEMREKSAHEDFLSRYENNKVLSHTKETEHHGAQFWHYSYAGETPDAILNADPVAHHIFGTPQEQAAIKDHMLSSEFAEEMTDSGLISNQKWLDEMYLATSAFDQQDHIEAERHLRCALEETNRWDSVDGRTYKTLVLYAAAMSALGRFDRAQELHQRATDVLKQMSRKGIVQNRRDKK